MDAQEAVALIENSTDDELAEFAIAIEVNGWEFTTDKAHRSLALAIAADLGEDVQIKAVYQYKAWQWEEL